MVKNHTYTIEFIKIICWVKFITIKSPFNIYQAGNSIMFNL